MVRVPQNVCVIILLSNLKMELFKKIKFNLIIDPNIQPIIHTHKTHFVNNHVLQYNQI